MDPGAFRAQYPLILKWNRETLATHAANARPVASLRLPQAVATESKPRSLPLVGETAPKGVEVRQVFLTVGGCSLR
jgi:hypothetical protein